LRRGPASAFLRAFLLGAGLAETVRWKEVCVPLYIYSIRKAGNTIYREKKTVPKGDKKRIEKKGKKGVDKRGRIWYSNEAVSAERSSSVGGGEYN